MFAVNSNLLNRTLIVSAIALIPSIAQSSDFRCDDYLSQPWVVLRDHKRSKNLPMVPFTEPGIVRVRTSAFYGDLDLEQIRNYYDEWKYLKLNDSERNALTLWGTAFFREINAYWRGTTPRALVKNDVVQVSHYLDSSLSSAPAIQNNIKEVYRGESHSAISLEEARAWVQERKTLTWNSYFAASIFENQAFLFARDYHASVAIGDGLLNIPLSALQAPIEQQVLYRVVLPEKRDSLHAIYVGNGANELLFERGMQFHVVGADVVHYISKYSPVERVENGEVFHYLLEEGELPETRLLITLSPLLK